MRKTRTLLSLLLCVTLLLGMLGCNSQTPAGSGTTDPPGTEAPTEPPVSDLYTEAAQLLRDAQDLAVELTTKKTITASAGTFQLVSDQELTLTGIGTESFAASMTEDLEIGDCYDRFTEYYEDGVLFVNIYDVGRFQGGMTEADFLARFAPAVLLDESLYANVSAEESDSGVTLTFSDPTAPESWALPEGAEFLRASGSAKIADGALTKTTYTMEYTQGGTTVSMEVTAKAEVYNDDPLKAPPEPTVYKVVDSIDALRLYDTAIMYLYSAETASSTLTQTLLSQAAGYSLSEQSVIHYTGTGEDHASDIQYTASSSDSSSGTEVYTQTEHYQDGVYTFQEADGEPEVNPEITPEDMVEYLQGQFNDGLPALDYISTATAEDLGGVLYLEMELTEKWGEETGGYASYLLYQDEEFLNNYASAYKTTNRTYYMALDPATGFPLSGGMAYSGVHTIEGVDYILAMEITQSYRLADSGTYEEITGESLPEEAPETQATPLLYRVTGADGQEMYLMGTIHVGDNRTAYLPDEIYTALDASDALAVEADIAVFEEQMESDPEIAAQIAAAYINSDGSATKDQLDAAVYDEAVKLLKASGNYSINMEYMKPYLWSSSIENFYLTLGSLQAEKGMDMRLLKLAKEQGKEIREVESGMFQIEMLAGFSPELQVMLLEEAIGYTVAEYCAEVQTLYELWCAGDESALREKLAEESAEFTEEERVLYEEYVDAMIIQRNEGMLDVASSYLESGDTVFYAVGLAHLLQENGLVDTLRDAGYTVEQVTYN